MDDERRFHILVVWLGPNGLQVAHEGSKLWQVRFSSQPESRIRLTGESKSQPQAWRRLYRWRGLRWRRRTIRNRGFRHVSSGSVHNDAWPEKRKRSCARLPSNKKRALRTVRRRPACESSECRIFSSCLGPFCHKKDFRIWDAYPMKVDTPAPFDKVVDLFLRNSIRRNLNT